MIKLTDGEIAIALGCSNTEIADGDKKITDTATSKACWKLWQILMELGYRAAARKVKAILEAEGIEKWREG